MIARDHRSWPAVLRPLLTLGLIASTGCYSFRPATGLPAEGTAGRVRFESRTAVDVVRGKSGKDTVHLRPVKLIEGRVLRIRPDTLEVLVIRTWPQNPRVVDFRAIVPLNGAVHFDQRKVSATRTTLAVAASSFVLYALISFVADSEDPRAVFCRHTYPFCL